jgi:hypothetical protein
MALKRPLVLGVAFLKGFNASKKMEDDYDSAHIKASKKKGNAAISLDSCFNAYGGEELLTGND